MPSAGEEGYESIVTCPYDKSHQIRRGGFQFHLKKCRDNNKLMEKVVCPFNSTHMVPKVELQYHKKMECDSRKDWDRHTHDIGDPNCPVKDLVPVNAATVPDGDECWDDYETQGSVLNNLKSQAEERGILRMMQCESKAKRKTFREQERSRHQELMDNGPVNTAPSLSASSTGPLPRPSRVPNIPVTRQDPEQAVAVLNKQFRTHMDIKSSDNVYPPSDTSSMFNGPRSVSPSLDSASVMSYASVSSRPSQPVDYAEATTSMRGPKSYYPEMSTAMTSALSSTSRRSTAMSIESSVNRLSNTRYQEKASDETMYPEIVIPGIGRSKARQRVRK